MLPLHRWIVAATLGLLLSACDEAPTEPAAHEVVIVASASKLAVGLGLVGRYTSPSDAGIGGRDTILRITSVDIKSPAMSRGSPPLSMEDFSTTRFAASA